MFYQGKGTSLQKQTWEKLCAKFEEAPQTLSLFEMFQMSKLVERAMQRIKDEPTKREDAIFLEELQANVKYKLIQHGS
ncbi:MAG TPA: hypothetical protein VNX68_13180 [Nitrosopumilaceae archaeon]|nr:hypothetical protein [Nitrosopumilaceae archaeon]